MSPDVFFRQSYQDKGLPVLVINLESVEQRSSLAEKPEPCRPSRWKGIASVSYMALYHTMQRIKYGSPRCSPTISGGIDADFQVNALRATTINASFPTN